MSRPFRLALIPALVIACAAPAYANGIIGAGSGSTGGTLTGKTNESSPDLKTGAANGEETVPDKQDKGHSVGTGDNAVLNAPREAVPGTKSNSQPSNLNGQNAQP